MGGLDCVVIGYNEGDFDDYRVMCERTGPGTPEYQIMSSEHLVVDGGAMPWLEAFSRLRTRSTGRTDRYHVGEVYNLAALYLTSYLRRHGLRAEPVSLFSAERDRLAALLAERPAVVAVTTTFYVNILPVIAVVEFIREHAPDSHIVVGGPLVDNLCLSGITDTVQDLCHAMGADSYIQESQGEHSLAQLCQAVQAGADLDAVDNLLHCPDGTWVRTRRRPEANNLDECSIDWSGFTPAEIGTTAQLRTARSCAFKCSFCDYPSRAGALTTASIDTVRAELRALAELGVRNVVFVDDTFNVPPKRFKDMCRMMIEEDLGLNWYSYFRCSNARDDEAFDLAAASGCAGVFLGIESGDGDVLAAMHKLAQDSEYRSGIARLKERAITTFASIIVGFPGETEKTVRNTIDFLNETAPDLWRAQAWWANPRSPVFANKDLWSIQGEGYTWSHHTMNSAQAAAYTDEMFAAVTESVWLPLYDFDFWSLPYLDGKGVKAAELIALLRTSQQWMAARKQGAGDVALAEVERRLAEGIGGLTVAPAKFAY
ncbi:Radical SAM domain protein [Catenulispora acidiphila DSM 44928]|uniref:Radical SAM domain protein n=1 Tax=Catenulispora acidiphila (strain DSM 44928 / JCM 14897 / NBRC 102108 / NRRL B-24433 / ID139908) TaxID=479433 RepID=C7Q908_CATAD|nr:PhpK family radical SAM P-methyltransferase [Catenulispora acidiphila]ACU72328.1 Radical SAM domain protein [Catenulispora acidiphila DSM 44928]